MKTYAKSKKAQISSGRAIQGTDLLTRRQPPNSVGSLRKPDIELIVVCKVKASGASNWRVYMPCQGFSSLFNRNLLKSFKVPRKSHLNYRNGNEWGTADTNRTVQNSMGTFFPISLKSERILLYAVGVEKTNKHHCP